MERGKKSVKKKELRATALSIKEAKKGISNKNKVCCRVIVRASESSEEVSSLIGEIDKKQLLSTDSRWLTVHNAISTSRGVKSAFSVVSKADVVEIVVFKPTKRFVLDKVSLTLTKTIEAFEKA